MKLFFEAIREAEKLRSIALQAELPHPSGELTEQLSSTNNAPA